MCGQVSRARMLASAAWAGQLKTTTLNFRALVFFISILGVFFYTLMVYDRSCLDDLFPVVSRALHLGIEKRKDARQ